jgi:predicted nuclease of predicted toxin-antitoxin system
MSGGTRKRPEPVLFIDRDAWSRVLGKALTAAGITFVAHHQRFAPAVSDNEWLAVAGAEGWVVLTRDQNIRRRLNELAAVKAARVCMFVLGQGNLSAAETARIVVKAYPRILRAARGARRPAIFTLTRGGEIRKLKFRA